MDAADLIRRYLETLLSWPVVALVIALLFREPVTRLLGRIRVGEFGSFKIELETASGLAEVAGRTPLGESSGGLLRTDAAPPMEHEPIALPDTSNATRHEEQDAPSGEEHRHHYYEQRYAEWEGIVQRRTANGPPAMATLWQDLLKQLSKDLSLPTQGRAIFYESKEMSRALTDALGRQSINSLWLESFMRFKGLASNRWQLLIDESEVLDFASGLSDLYRSFLSLMARREGHTWP